MNNQKEWIEKGLKIMEESDQFCDYEKKVIEAVRKSDLSVEVKCYFHTILMDYGTEKRHSRHLANRLEKSYRNQDIETLVDKLVSFNPKLGYVSIEGGFERKDERHECSCYLTIPVPYKDDVEEYFKEAEPVLQKAKQVVRLLLTDAKKLGAR